MDFEESIPKKSARMAPAEQTGFFIAASDFDLLDHVSRMIKRQGMVGMMDTAGRMQYLVDGRKGTPLAARRILDTTQKLVRDMMLDPDELKPLRVLAVDEVLRRWQLMPRLKGYRYLRYILIVAAGNDRLLRPVGKMLYPLVSEAFKVPVSQIERDIRYCLRSKGRPGPMASNTAAISIMGDEVTDLVIQWTRQIKPPMVAETTMGSYQVPEE
ncbi:MAG: sporulation initiation factor Spo0A C-terminal domain-containing protein [Eubacteriales bacterium]|nr:sporulation initiation factor Spo0A C-terminal domain-containing protein [Eubacteriales bacterium]